MASLIGQTVSHYRILEHLGGGGMGVVYKAQDLQLDRVVALKFLPEQVGSTAEDRERFIREARMAAALNHPNIATVFEINDEGTSSEQPGQLFIAMEYVEGKTLRQMIDAGPMKIDEAIRTVIKIAEGLHAAHEKGIVHRDIKSANVMVSSTGQLKIMDFGLAKIAYGQTTVTSPGKTVGTAAYMSPEQARGGKVDQRADIWGLGVVFYELITGSLPFRGDYHNAILYAILNENPAPLTSVRTGVPIALDAIVAKMLAKDPAARYQHVEEIPVDLRTVGTLSESSRTLTAQMPPRPVHSGRPLTWAGVGIAIGTAMTAVLLRLVWPGLGTGIAQPETQRWSIALPDSTPLAPVGSAPLGIGQPSVAISPDGSQVAFVVHSSSGTFIHSRPLNRYESVRLPGTEKGYHPFFSPDGRWIGFFAGSQLKKISIDGGRAVTLCEATNPRGAVWAENDRIYFCDREGVRISWIPTSGGTPMQIKAVRARTFGAFEYPDMLPGGEAAVCGAPEGLKVVSLIGGSEKRLKVMGSSPHFLSTGYLVFYSGGSLLAAPFDSKRQEFTGTPIPVLSGVLAEAPHFGAHFDVSRNGTLVYLPGAAEVDSRLLMVRREGGQTLLPFGPTLFGTFQLSPDGRRLVILSRVLGPDVWIYDLLQNSRTRLTTDGNNGYPIWSPDGKWVLYSSGLEERRPLMRERSDGSGHREPLERGDGSAPYSFTPDGKFLGVTASDSASGNDVKAMNLESIEPPILIAGTAANEWGPSFSRDGRYIAYTSDESGQYEIYVQPFPPDGRRWQVSTEGGEEPVWSGTGRELFYRRGQEWVSVEVTTTTGFAMRKSGVIIAGNYVNVGGRSYDVTNDGTRFLVLERSDANVRLTELRVVTNWFRDVEEKVTGH